MALGPISRALLRELYEKRPRSMTTNELADAAGISWNKAEKVLNKLFTLGYLERRIRFRRDRRVIGRRGNIIAYRDKAITHWRLRAA